MTDLGIPVLKWEDINNTHFQRGRTFFSRPLAIARIARRLPGLLRTGASASMILLHVRQLDELYKTPLRNFWQDRPPFLVDYNEYLEFDMSDDSSLGFLRAPMSYGRRAGYGFRSRKTDLARDLDEGRLLRSKVFITRSGYTTQKPK